MGTERLKAIRGLSPMAEAERSKYDITDLKVGGYLAFRSQSWLVLDISRYLDVKWNNFGRRSRDEWTVELTIFSLKTDEVQFIEYYQDDEIEIYFTEKEVKLRELGISRADLEYFAEEEEGEVRYDGTTFYYSDDETAAALYFRNYMSGDEDHRSAERVRLYEFEADNGKCLTVEAWYDEPSDERPSREAFISTEVKSSTIEILQLASN